MIKSPLPKLSNWLIRRFLVFSSCSFLIAFFLFFIFFEDVLFSRFFLFFTTGFVFCFAVSAFLLLRLFLSLGRVIDRAERINSNKRNLSTISDSYLIEEPGELYELNKNLSQIHNYLRWQKRIISQESSELEAVISALTGAILAIDENKKVLFFNNRATLLFSSQIRLQRTEIHLSEIIRNPDILQVYNECLSSGQVIKKTLSIGAFEIQEEPFVYEITVAPLKPKGQNIKGAIGLFYDITNISKTEKIQLDFITNVSHELRTPLTAIQGYVETLLESFEDCRPDQIKQFLNIIQRNVKRLVSLLNHFLELSQNEENLELKKEELNTKEVTESIIKDMHIKDHKLKFDFSAKSVKADRLFLKQILYNLIDNAVKYAPKDSLIEILWSSKEEHVLLTVKDHGPGISARHRNRLFERFYRVDPSRTSVRGAGIGLSIVKQLVEKHSGTIEVKSRPQEGSTFICSFPD